MFEPVDPLTAEFDRQRRQVKAQALAAALNLWDQLVVGPDDASADRLVDALAPTWGVAAAQVTVLTDAYVDAFLEQFDITPKRTIPLDPEDIVSRVRPGVAPDELIRRPVKQVRYAIAEGSDLQGALGQGRRRLESIANTDVQQAFRLAFRERMADETDVRAYRRTLTGGENCAICVVATTQRYWSDQLMPIHPGCDCGVQPIVGPAGRIIDRDRLDQVKKLLKDEGVKYGDRAEMANTKIRVNIADADDVTEVPHGELGPILGVSKHRSTEFSDLPGWVRRSRREFADDGSGRVVRGSGRSTLGPSRT